MQKNTTTLLRSWYGCKKAELCGLVEREPVPDNREPVQSGLGAPGKRINTQFMMERSQNVKFNSFDVQILLL